MSAPNITLQDDLTPLAAELAGVQDTIAHFQLTEAALKTKIRELVAGPDSYAAGGLTVVVSANRRFNPAKAALVIPAELLPLVSVATSVVDKKKVEVLCPAHFDDCFIEHDLIVKLK